MNRSSAMRLAALFSVTVYAFVVAPLSATAAPDSPSIQADPTICVLTPGFTAVMRYDGTPGSWSQIGGPVSLIHGGGGLSALDPNNDDIYRNVGSATWELAGGPAYPVAFSASTLYAITRDRGAVMRYNGTPGSWTQIGGPAGETVPCP